MICSGSLVKIALVAVLLASLVESGQSGSIPQRVAVCCKKVNKLPLDEPITGFTVQEVAPPCVKAVIFHTKTGYYCSQLTAPWVRRKINDFMRARARPSPTPTVSLFSIITSTTSPSSSSSAPLPSSALPSIFSTPESPAGETFTDGSSE